MQENFFYKFQGFSGIDSKCHLRIVAELGKPVVIVCSQPPDNTGTSVQNAYEIIREQAYKYLLSKETKRKKVLAAESLDDFAAAIEKTQQLKLGVVVFLLKQIAGVLKNEKSILDLLKKENLSVVWLEHWPPGTGLTFEESYSLVSEDETGSPQWRRVDVSDFAEELGYTADQLSIPKSTFL